MEDRPEALDEEEEEDVEGLQKPSTAGVNVEGQSKKDVVEDEEDEALFSRSGPLEGRSTLFLISTYVIGKEKILTAVAKRCNCLIYVTEKKLSVLKCLNLENIDIFTTDPSATNVHVVQWSFLGETWPYFRPNFLKMEKAMKESGYKKVVGFVPTGWTYELKKKTFSVRKKGPFEIHLVPYSEHSNYEELREYVGFLRPKEIIPTVGLDGGGMESKAVATMRKHFRNLVDETASKKNFLKGFSRKPQEETILALKESGAGQQHVAPAPKAIFGRAARKRKREGDDGPEEFEDATQQTQGVKPMSDEIQDQANAAESMDMSKSTDVTSGKWQLALVPCAGPVDVERACPKPQHSTGSEDVSHRGRQEPVPPRISSSTPPSEKPGNKTNNERPRAQPSNPQTGSSAKTKSSSSTRRQPKAQGRQTKSASSRKTKKINASAPISKKAMLSPKNSNSAKPFQKAKQSSLFTFFKKAGEEPSAATSASVPSTEQLMMLAGNVTGLISREGSDKPSVRQVQNDINKWTDEYEQLASLLDENLSKELAHALLEKAGGNVGVALDLYYSGELVVEADKPSEARDEDLPGDLDTGVVDHGIEAKGNVDHKQVVHVTKAEGNISRSPETEMAGDSLQRPRSSSRGHSRVKAEAKPEVSANENSHPEVIVHKVRTLITVKEEIAGDVCVANHEITGVDAETADEKKRGGVGEEKLDGATKKDTAEKKSGSVAVPVGKYSPIEHACWEPGEGAPYLHLARAFDLVEQESGRLRTADMLCNMFRSLLALSPDAVLPAVYLTTNRLAPDFESVDLNIGGSIVSTAVGEVAGVSRAKLREMYTSMGDLGDVAQACRQTQSILRLPPPLRICQVFSTLKQISKESGGGSGGRKKDLVLSLLRACREKEMKYIVRTLVQNMRIGAMMKTVLSALAQAVVLHHTFPADQAPNEALAKLKPKFQEAAIAVVEAYNFLPNLDLLVPTLVKGGVAALSANISISPGTPIKPMLAKITNGIPELLKRFEGQSFTCEYKYDGQRAQIHMLADGSFRIFSRNCEDTTGRFPDVADICRAAAREDLTSFIIDAEVVAVDREHDNKLMAFQHLSTRERGSRDGGSVNLQNIKVSVCVFAFDMMYANQESLVKMTFRERRKCMRHWFPNIKPGHFGYATEITIEPEDDQSDSTSTSQKVEGFLEETFAASCEGLMAKALDVDSNYMASKRSDSWLKIKRDYMEGLNDSLDLVPIGAWYGNGRKAGWYSPFLLACYDPEREEYQSVCRVMSGFTDVFYKEMKEFYSGDRILPKKPTYYQTGEECNVWFTPELVWEIRGADFTVSPVHQAAVGLIHPSRGISMRFPRYIRSRQDKNPEISSSPSDIAELFHQQTRKVDVAGSKSKAVDRSGSPDE
ncbi:DNA ligase 1 [Marchantia polymorpha subsp. ruderalis]|nr:hypothetical protein MARPO_0069s0045 [Marchantia polymorpha]BBN03501.1 hypothetical protein Mp_2g23970 [Marchantia polymorpha subsp. ruderalis]|eukprot:PTQ35705.1 hypothetical protein MARPO_0069s0045 [Marchantia polymorpha]